MARKSRDGLLYSDKPRESKTPFEPLLTAWEGRIQRAKDVKWEQFGKFAEEAVEFYAGPEDMHKFYDSRMRGRKNGVGFTDEDSGFLTSTNKASELVQLLGPSLYHRNPIRTVTVRSRMPLPRAFYVDPQMEKRVAEQVQQMQQQMQQLQQQLQQLQQQAQQDPMAGQMLMQAQQQMQMMQQQIQQIQQPLQQAQQNYQNLVDQEAMAAQRRQLKAQMLDQILNYTPHELDLKTESRLEVNESLVKGMGCAWTETVDRGGVTLVGTFYDSVDNLLMDPDVDKMSDVRWIARKCIHTVAEIAEKYDVNPEKLKKHAKSHTSSADSEDDVANEEGIESVECDLVTYYQVYSTMGFGDEFPGMDEEYVDLLNELGKNVYLAFVPGMSEPLNFGKKHFKAAMETAEAETISPLESEPSEAAAENPEVARNDSMDVLVARANWPIPFWMDRSWPVEMLYFHEMFGQIWPMSHLRPAMPELKAINYANNHLLNRSKETSRLIIGYDKTAELDVIAALKSGKPITAVGFSRTSGDDISKMMSIVQQPQGGATELLAVKADLNDQFAKRTGLSEVMYSQMGGMRSAAEAQMKDAAKNIRPDDMSNTVEDWQSRIASKEALAILWLLGSEDVAPIIGVEQAKLWDQYIANEDPHTIAMELDVRIEAGSIRKPNRDTQVQQMNETMQAMGQTLNTLAIQGGHVGPYNALMTEWGKAHDIKDIERFLLPEPPPPQPPQPDPTKMAELQMKQQASQQDGQLKMALGQMQVQAAQAKTEFAKQIADVKMQVEMIKAETERKKMEMELQAKAVSMQLDQAKAASDFQQNSQKHNAKMQQEGDRAQLQSKILERRAAASQAADEKKAAVRAAKPQNSERKRR